MKCFVYNGINYRKGTLFTLVELLVVISIILILISILLPSLNKARESGESAVCRSNAKQILLGYLSYTADYNDYYLPLAAIDEYSSWSRRWGHRLYFQGYVPQVKTFLCPTSLPRMNASSRTNLLSGNPNIDRFSWQHIGYALNCREFGAGGSSDAVVSGFLKTSQVKSPSRFLIFTESTQSFTNLTPFNAVLNHYSDDKSLVSPIHHSRQATTAYADGHVGTVSGRSRAAYYTPDSVLKSYQVDNNAWTFNAKSRTDQTRR